MLQCGKKENVFIGLYVYATVICKYCNNANKPYHWYVLAGLIFVYNKPWDMIFWQNISIIFKTIALV